MYFCCSGFIEKNDTVSIILSIKNPNILTLNLNTAF
ncbi:hypothetical protein CHRYSEOSP005_20080 [Chryseobacterium sp. Alg-005]